MLLLSRLTAVEQAARDRCRSYAIGKRGACRSVRPAWTAGGRKVEYPQKRTWAASADSEDEQVIAWARQNGLRYYYATEPALSGRCLKVHLGHLTAYFRSGKLARLWVHADGEYLDEVFHQLTQLFELCVQIGGYLDQQVVVSPADVSSFLAARR
ncbi:MAG: hypothetical protein V2A79_06245 [Planctomycetota bacterium]